MTLPAHTMVYVLIESIFLAWKDAHECVGKQIEVGRKTIKDTDWLVNYYPVTSDPYFILAAASMPGGEGGF